MLMLQSRDKTLINKSLQPIKTDCFIIWQYGHENQAFQQKDPPGKSPPERLHTPDQLRRRGMAGGLSPGRMRAGRLP